MTCDELHDRLADLLGNELPPDQRAAADQHLADCDACRRLADGFASVERLLRRHVPNVADATAAAAPLAPGRAAPPTRRAALVGLRYAAVIAVGFLGGYAARAPRDDRPVPPPAHAVPAIVDATPLNAALVSRYQALESAYPGAPAFSRALVALARP